MMNIQEKANKLAKEAGFDVAKYLGKKGIFNVYVCDFKGRIGETGLPMFLLEHNGEIQYAAVEETRSLMDSFIN